MAEGVSRGGSGAAGGSEGVSRGGSGAAGQRRSFSWWIRCWWQ